MTDPIVLPPILPDDHWFWLSFADPYKLQGDQSLGVIIGHGATIGDVITRIHLLGINPGGEIGFVEIGDVRIHQVESHRWQLLSKARLEELGFIEQRGRGDHQIGV